MSETISIREFAAIKRVAMNVAPWSVKKQKVASQIVALGEELKKLNEQIEGSQTYIKQMTGGLTTENLVKRVVVPYTNEDGTPKTDKDGKALYLTKYLPNEDVLEFDEKHNCYIIKEADGGEGLPEPPVEE